MPQITRFSRFLPIVAIAGLVLTMVLSVPFLGQASVAAQGNSQNAKLCQKGGWQNLQTSEGQQFSSQDECVSAGAQGAVLEPIPPPSGSITIIFRSSIATGSCALHFSFSGFAANQEYTLSYVHQTPSGTSEQYNYQVPTNGDGEGTLNAFAEITKGLTVEAWMGGVSAGPNHSDC